jgi:hypothetical protein
MKMAALHSFETYVTTDHSIRRNIAKVLNLQQNRCHNVKTRTSLFCNTVKGKGKAVPLQAWGGPEGSRKLRFPDYMTTAQDGGQVVSPTHRPPLPPGNTPGTHFC